MLRPKKSLLAVFGVTRELDRVRGLRALTPCGTCSYANCQYRREPYVRPPLFSLNEAMLRTESAAPPAVVDAPAAVRSTPAFGPDASTPSTPRHWPAGRETGLRWRPDGNGADPRALPLRGHDLHQYGSPVGLRLQRDARAARRRDIRSKVRCVCPRRAMTATPRCADSSKTAPSCCGPSPTSGRSPGGGFDEALAWRRPALRRGLLLRAGKPHAQVGPGAGNHPLRAVAAGEGGCRGPDAGGAAAMKKSFLEALDDGPLLGRRRHGHAAHAGRAGAGRLRRGVESDPPRARARHPAGVCRGGLRLPAHEHLRRLADHAQPTRPRQRCGRDQSSRRRNCPPGVRRRRTAM